LQDATAGTGPKVDIVNLTGVAAGAVPKAVVVGSSGVTAGAVQLQGSNATGEDDLPSDWTSIGSPTTVTAGTGATLAGGATAYRRVRAVVTTPIVGGTATVVHTS
jgi:hypothetical protein